MMSASFEKMLLSRPFKFLVGPNEVEMVVHEEAIANQSTALNTLMRGKMSESQAGAATWKDIDEGTFARYAQFAYTGDYSVPGMVVSIRSRSQSPCEVPEAEPIVEEDAPPDDDWGNWSSKKSKKKRSKHALVSQKITYTPFKSLTYPLREPRSRFEQSCHPTIVDGFEDNIMDALLSHTSLYVLADKWDVESLKVLTLYKLHESLNMLELDTTKVPDIVELVRRGYSETMDRDAGIDDLRELVCQYVASNVKVMSEDETFATLIEEGGAFVRDLWRRVLPRVE